MSCALNGVLWERYRCKSMKTEILSMLRSTSDYVSGQSICKKFGVSRTAVWKIINQLKEEGYEIEAVQKKGYRLLEIGEVISESELKSRMKTKWLAREIYYYDEIDSTNTRAKQHAEEGCPQGALVVSNMQKAGKGSRGRGWQSPSGAAVYMSLVLRPKFLPNKASMVTLIMALAVVKAIKETTELSCQIKWPNDVIINKRKVCGILTEMSGEQDYIQYIVIGVGINVKEQTFPDDIRQKATSLEEEVREINRKEVPKRAYLIERTMYYFEEYYELFEEKESLAFLKEEYNQYLVNKEKEVKVLGTSYGYTGICHGINENGELLVETEKNTLEKVCSGEVSVRGIYGYV